MVTPCRLRRRCLSALGVSVSTLGLACQAAQTPDANGAPTASDSDVAVSIPEAADPEETATTESIPEPTRRPTDWQPNEEGAGCTVERDLPDSVAAADEHPRCPSMIHPVADHQVRESYRPRPPQFSDGQWGRFDHELTNRARAEGAIEQCCYREWIPRPVRGRVLAGATGPITAETVDGAGWATRPLDVQAKQPDVAARWLEAAGFEHASVAAFSRLALQLLALGAPGDLVERVQQAALEEVEHASLAYSMAAAYGLPARGPGPLPMPRIDAIDFPELVRTTFREGCVEEACAALIAARQAEAAEGESVRRAFEEIAEDEAGHAALAWGVLGWALRSGGKEARAALEEELAGLTLPEPGAPGSAALRSSGWLGSDEERAATAEAIEEVVRPCARALLRAQS